MNLRMYILAVFAAFSFLSCNSSGENQQEIKLTATINGEEWQFFEVDATRGDGGIEITGLGYLEGNQGAVPVHLTMKVVDVPAAGEIATPYEAYFSPNTQENAALATIRPEDQPEAYDTQLDPNAIGTLTITEATNNQFSGEFNFVATDKAGRKLEVENGRFNKLSL
jgi:hypothetical protein